ncbi:MAG: LacI family DNA-binding transcriptional regulator [Chloroflexota bacterium]|nr:LacI family DNA-binding transcriptional regulator [Chloroflexota bacterium]
MGRRITIADIARRADVSKTTVSRVLNNKPDVDKGTRERILRIIEETGYVANAMARGLRHQRTGRIGLLLYIYVHGIHAHRLHIASEYYFEMIRGVAYRAEELGYNLVLYTSLAWEGALSRLTYLCRAREVDGLILMGAGEMQPLIEVLNRESLPFIVVNQRIAEDPTVSYIAPDNERGAYQATRHLIELGHRRIAYISRPADVGTDADRQRGYRLALDEANLHFDASLCSEASFELGSGYQAMERLLNLDSRPTSVFAFNDPLAIEALHAIHDRGLRIPQDVAVVGFDDVHSAAVVIPSLTTVHQPLFETGAEAMDRLISLLCQEETEPTRVVMPVKLIVRESTVF